MNFIQKEKHKGEPIQKALIESREDIPERVLEYFNYSNEFMCNLVGKENVIYSAIHFDENTPHMHFFMKLKEKFLKRIKMVIKY